MLNIFITFALSWLAVGREINICALSLVEWPFAILRESHLKVYCFTSELLTANSIFVRLSEWYPLTILSSIVEIPNYSALLKLLIVNESQNTFNKKITLQYFAAFSHYSKNMEHWTFQNKSKTQ